MADLFLFEDLMNITIESREGTMIYVPATGDREGTWRMLPKNGKGTRPIPKRLQNQAKGAAKRG